MTRKRENLVHKIFVCAAIFKLGHLEYGANFKLEHYRVNVLTELHLHFPHSPLESGSSELDTMYSALLVVPSNMQSRQVSNYPQ